jgi:predicted alpha/beta-fold hydrolase
MIEYRPPRWLPGGHLQTIFPYFFRKAPRPVYRRERIETPDGDFVDLDWLDGRSSAPLVVLFHGLEGSSSSHYARALMHAGHLHGWNGVVAHWRGCSGEPNRLPRAYHSGDHAEAGWLLEAIAGRARPPAMFAVGVSLGGSALLNWLGRAGDDASSLLGAAAAVSAPLSLRVGGESIARGFNKVYTWNFLRTMRRKAYAKARQFPGLIDIARVRRCRTLWDFDDAVTAPLHGFAGADDYWDRGSSLGWLHGIRVPTLILNAKNDPFLPFDELPGPLVVSAAVHIELTEQGGHVGFLQGPLPGDPLWLPGQLLHYFEQHLSTATALCSPPRSSRPTTYAASSAAA